MEVSVKTFLDSVTNPNTKKEYRHGVKKFVEWFGKSAEEVLALRQDDLTQKVGENIIEYKNRASRFEREIKKFHAHLLSSGCTLNTSRNQTIGIRQLFRFYQMPVTLRAGCAATKTVKTTRNFPLSIEHVRQMYAVADLREWRDYVDRVKWTKRRDEIFVKLTYLLAARFSEVSTVCRPYDLAHHRTADYGKLLSWELGSYRDLEGKTLKLILVRSPIAKRKKKLKEDSLIVPMKTVPVILGDHIEPWGRDIANWLLHTELSKGQLNFNFGSTTATQIVKANLRGIDKGFHLHLLRHYRISHLITNYGFNPYELTSFTGWSIGSTFGALGIKASSNIDVYSHLSWKSYIDKLALPLDEVL